MRKFIVIMLFAFGMIATTQLKAQSVKMATAIGGTKQVDTCDNTETNYFYYRIPSSTSALSVHVFATKISGTPNACVTVSFSNSTVFDANTFTTISAADTVHIGTGSYSNGFVNKALINSTSSTPMVWVQVKAVGRGTASFKFNSFLYLKN
jgi:hypothetical protein